AAAVERRAGLRDPLPPGLEKRKSGKKKLPVAASTTHRITVMLEESAWASVRALQVLLALGEVGKLITSSPSQTEIEREDAHIGDAVVVDLQTPEPESALHEALNRVPELGSVTVVA